MKKDNRRIFLKKLGSGLAFTTVYFSGLNKLFAGLKPMNRVNFPLGSDRTWLGEQFWSIPMEDWQSKNGRIEFTGTDINSRVNILSHVIESGAGNFEASVDLGVLEKAKSGSAGFRVAIVDQYDEDIKAACYFGEGINAGISTDGYIFIGDKKVTLPNAVSFDKLNLKINIVSSGKQSELTLTCKLDGKETTVSQQINKDLEGVVALVNNFTENGGDKFWFKNLTFSGDKVQEKTTNNFGPILWTMYTLSKGVLKISVQMPPIGDADSQQVSLYFKKKNSWKKIQTSNIDKDAYTALFKLTDYKVNQDQDFKIVYQNGGKTHEYKGTVRKEPKDRKLKLGSLTCQEAQAYPYSPLIKNLPKHNPDILLFSGDQIYEQNGGYPIKRTPEKASMLSYLGKWYMFGWAFADVMRDRPTICTPDDHDVFQGNLWGEGGEPIELDDWVVGKARDAHGGYVQTPRMVNTVHRTQCSHLPNIENNEPTPFGISTWHTDLLYGGISFAIISDRMFKSGPELVRSGEGRIDHLTKPVTVGQLEKPELEFLGKAQMNFLEKWALNWKDIDMKVLISQTVFANVGTHHGNEKMFLYGDMDSGGWPKNPKDDVIRLIRKAYAFHITGDQHLPFIVQYSTDQPRDGVYTFCSPSISTGYIRWGQPDIEETPFTDRPPHGLPNTGLYTDGFGNKNYIYAVGNPKDDWRNKNRYIQAQNKSSGFGIISFNTAERTIKMEAFKFESDFDNPTPHDQYPGWPHTINQTDNDGRSNTYFLPQLNINRPNQLVKLMTEDNELINILRLSDTPYQPMVATMGKFNIEIGEGSNVKKLSLESSVSRLNPIDVTI